MSYYEVLLADARYRAEGPLTYSYEGELPRLNLVSVPLRGRIVYGFISGKVQKPKFSIKSIRSAAEATLPEHSLTLAKWMAEYYACSLGEALRQFTPGGPAPRLKTEPAIIAEEELTLGLDAPLMLEQKLALSKIKNLPTSTILLHGETGSGKTRVYLELADEQLKNGQSVIMLVPEIALTAQIALGVKQRFASPVHILHSQLSSTERKKIWLAIANQTKPVVILGARSALFAPVKKLGLVVLDEAHEAAYQQDQSPRYRASRVASRLAGLTGAKVILGTATPLVEDYYLARSHGAVVRMRELAAGRPTKVKQTLVDMKDKSELSTTPYFSRALLKAMSDTLARDRQCLIYLNRRGTARVVMCVNCGWRGLCPRCDLPLVYHGDEHRLRCHSCGFWDKTPVACPHCGSVDIIYRSAGTKQLADSLAKLFPNQKLARFDSDNLRGGRLNELYKEIRSGRLNILIGTQLLAKGLDLPKLGLVGIVNADSSLNMPDFSAGERTFQLLYQVIGRVGRGHGSGQVVVQTYLPDNAIIKAALERDYNKFYNQTLKERRRFHFPPTVHLMKLGGRYSSAKAAEAAGQKLTSVLRDRSMSASISEPAPSFYERRGNKFYWQIVVKSKNRSELLELAKAAGDRWSVELDPLDLF